jgi:AcrR family transcriptional regulator
VSANFLNVKTQTQTRKSAQVRREEIIEAAMAAFALHGLHGTSTEAIAERAGISQPYLFRLFGTKKDLFLATIERGFRRTLATFQEAAAAAGPGEGVFRAMGMAYIELLADRKMLMGQLQAYAACDDPEVRELVRREFAAIYRFVESVSGGDGDGVHRFFKTGMLINTAAAMDLGALDEPWARDYMKGCAEA